MITVFTSTYNRSYIIVNLYNSLCVQTSMDFEWLIIDDGSTDNTEELISSFILQNKIVIRYIKQENGGKHRAINRGVKEAKGDVFFIVDSDDYLSNMAIEYVLKYYKMIKNDDSFAGVYGMKSYPNGDRVCGDVDFDIIKCTLLDFRYKYGIYGDLADVYKTEILKEYPFPDIENEKFCSESYVWYKIASKYKMLFFNKKIYICDYLDDGLSVNSFLHRKNSPVASMLTYLEIYHSNIPFWGKLKALISYWRFYFYSSKSMIEAFRAIGVLGVFFFPIGFFIYLIEKNRT